MEHYNINLYMLFIENKDRLGIENIREEIKYYKPYFKSQTLERNVKYYIDWIGKQPSVCRRTRK